MADTQIHPTGDVPTPGDYVIPGSAELLLKNAFARFDGSGAAGDFIPLLRVISDAGSVVVEAVADTTIAAGASADSSWFPRVAAARPATAAAALQWCYANGDISTDGASHPALSNFAQSAGGPFALNGSADGLVIAASGTYLAFVDVDVEDAATALATAFTLTTIWTGNPAPSDRIKGPVSQTGAQFGVQRRWEPSAIDLATVTSSATLTYVVDAVPGVTLDAYTALFVVRLGPSH